MTSAPSGPPGVRWHDVDEATLAARLRRWADWLRAQPDRANLLITLHGDLGAGKTTFARLLLRALGVGGRIKSPTFALVEPYELDLGSAVVPAWHADLYRLDDPREWDEAGLTELLGGSGLRLVEWPERAGGRLGPPDLAVQLATGSDESRRELTLQASTPAGQAALQALTDDQC